MTPNTKGQVFSIDFLLAVGLVILAIGVSLNTLHTAAANEQERINQFELETIGQTAAILLVTNPQLECQLHDGTPPMAISPKVFIPGCLNTQKTISKQTLGIPAGFEYNLESGVPLNTNGMSAAISATAKNVYRTEIDAMAWSGQLNKSDYDQCIESGCPINPLTPIAPTNKISIQLGVWKA